MSALTVGVIGLGHMGLGMALTLAGKGVAVVGCDVNADRQSIAKERGLRVENLDSLAAEANAVILSLPLAAHVAQVVEGENGLLARLGPGAVIIDTSTSEPDVTRRLCALSAAQGIAFVDAPVSGGPTGAAAGSLTAMVGGSETDVERARPILEAIAAKIVYAGPSGAGHVVKLVNNLLVAAHLLLMSEAMRLSDEAGVPAADALKVINAASGRSAVSEVNYPRWILPNTFDSGFTMGLMRKDVRLAASLAARTGVSLPMAELAAQLWRESEDRLDDDEDFNRIAVVSA